MVGRIGPTAKNGGVAGRVLFAVFFFFFTARIGSVLPAVY